METKGDRGDTGGDTKGDIWVKAGEEGMAAREGAEGEAEQKGKR